MPTSCARMRASSTARCSASSSSSSSGSPSPPMRQVRASHSTPLARAHVAPSRSGRSGGSRVSVASLPKSPLPRTGASPWTAASAPAAWRGVRTPTPFAIAAAALVAATVLSRLPFMTQTLYAFDSANYALAVSTFYNVAFHQPHPPGYPLYVFFGRAIDVLVHDANRSLVFEGIVWSALASACTIALGRALYGRAAGLLSGLLLVCTVGFWGYGEVAYPYVALAGETSALAFLAHEVLTGRRTLIIPLGAVWAVSLGVRWDGAIFCLLIALWALWAAHWRLSLASAGLAALIVVAFALPMIALTGGWDVYRQAIRSEE